MNTALGIDDNEEMTLEELVRRARGLIERAMLSLDDERVTATPDARTIRYYQTIGVVNKPRRYEGRQAVYGYEHLLQVVATKLLQAKGYSLAQIQQTIPGASVDELESALSDEIVSPMQEIRKQALETRRSNLDESRLPLRSRILPFSKVDSDNDEGETEARQLIAVELGRGISLTIDPKEVPDPDAIIARITKILDGER
jgi:DNA-binding transcriptional MerR regulator